MIIYNTTFHVEDDIHDDYLIYIKEKIVPRVMDSGVFDRPQLALIHPQHEEKGTSYSLQFCIENLDKFNEWMQADGHKIHSDIGLRFGQKVMGFMTLLEKIDL